MRVLIVSHRFPPDAVAGVERYTEALAAELRRRGDQVAVVARRPGSGAHRTEVETHVDGTRVYRLAGGGVDRDRFLRGTAPLETAFEEVLAEERPDVVHLNHMVDLSPRLPLLAREAGAGVVLTLHDFWFACPRITLQRPDGSGCEGPDGGRACASHCFQGTDRGRWGLRALYFRRLLGIADRVLCPSAYVAEWFRAWAADPARIRAVPNGIWIRPPAPDDVLLELRERRRVARRADEGGTGLVLAILGAVVPHKGHHVVLEAIAEAGLTGVDVHVHGPVGDVEYAARLRREADGIEGLRLRLFGPYEPDELTLMLEDVDCVIVPSTWPETFCLVAREALAIGLPVVATRLGALPDAIRDGVDGILFRHDRPDALGKVLRRLVEEEGLLARLREGAGQARPTTMAEHTDGVREAYVEARAAVEQDAAAREVELAELGVLHELLEAHGFGAPALEVVA